MLRKPDHASIALLPDDDMLKVVCKLLETWGPQPKKAGRLGPLVLLEFVTEENTLKAYELLKLWGFNAMMEDCWITCSTRVQGNPFVDQRVFQAVFQGHLQRDAVANYLLYRDLITEELKELDAATTPEAHLDALIDLIYVVIGAGVALRHDMQGAWNEVHRTNMNKLGPDGKPIIRESDGKVLKPEGWEPPDLERFVGVRMDFPEVATAPCPPSLSLLQELQLIASSRLTAQQINPNTMAPWILTGAQLMLPQSHREEVELFVRVGQRLALEAKTITPEDFAEIMRLLPEVFPGITRRTGSLLPVGEMIRYLEKANLDQLQATMSAVAYAIQQRGGEPPCYCLTQLQKAWDAAHCGPDGAVTREDFLDALRPKEDKP